MHSTLSPGHLFYPNALGLKKTEILEDVTRPHINQQRSMVSSNHYFIQDLKKSCTKFSKYLFFTEGSNSEVGIVTRYGLDGEGIES
jgi:hypothetical protein